MSLIVNQPFNSLLPDLGTEGLPETLYAEDYLDMASDAAKIAREESAKSKFTAKCYKQFSVSAPSGVNMLDLWTELATSIRYETIKKLYVHADHEIRDNFLAGELRGLGTPEELKKLRGAAIIHDQIEEELNRQALYENTKLLRAQSLESAVLSKDMSTVAKTMVNAIRVLTVKYLD